MGWKCNAIKNTVRTYREPGDHIGNKINNQIPKNPIHLPSPTEMKKTKPLVCMLPHLISLPRTLKSDALTFTDRRGKGGGVNR
jgi:hypothetical protein